MAVEEKLSGRNRLDTADGQGRKRALSGERSLTVQDEQLTRCNHCNVRDGVGIEICHAECGCGSGQRVAGGDCEAASAPAENRELSAMVRLKARNDGLAR